MATVTIYPRADFTVGVNITGMNGDNQSHAGMDDIYQGGGDLISGEVISGVISSTSTEGVGWGAYQVSVRGKTSMAISWHIRRLILSFANLQNTTHAADLPNSTVTAVSVNLYGFGSNASTGRGMSLSNHYSEAPSLDEETLPPTGFDAYTFGDNLITSAINMSDSDALDEFDFNSDGIAAVQAAIDGTGNFTFGVMDSDIDYAYSEGDGEDGTYIGGGEDIMEAGTGVYLSDYAGTTRDPRIIITYTPAGPSGYGHEAIGVASANISKIKGVATANISKFIGV